MDSYILSVENEFSNMSNRYYTSDRTGTSCKDVLQLMVDLNKEKIWWWAWEFVGKTNSKGKYLSHRSPARVSDLALHTDLVEDRKIGRFKVYRVKRENRDAVVAYLKSK